MSAGTPYSEKYLVLPSTNLLERLFLVCEDLIFLHLCIMLSYKFMKHVLCNSNNVLLSVARLCRLSKNFKTLESHIAVICEVEFCSVGLLQKSIRPRFEESLL